VKHEHNLGICFEIHLSVQTPFHGAGVEESTVLYAAPFKQLPTLQFRKDRMSQFILDALFQWSDL
jgi:hypothetical protein